MWTNLQILAGLFTFITVIFRKAPLFAKWKLINIHLKSDHLRSYFWSEYRKIRTRNNSVFRHFSRSDLLCFVHILFEIFCVTYHWSANLFCWRDVLINNACNIVFPFKTYKSTRQIFCFYVDLFLSAADLENAVFRRENAVCWACIFLRVLPIKTEPKFWKADTLWLSLCFS